MSGSPLTPPGGVRRFSLTLARVEESGPEHIARRTLRLSGSEAFATFRYLTSEVKDVEAEEVVERLRAAQIFWPGSRMPISKLWKIIDVEIEFGPCAPDLTTTGGAP